MCRAACAKSLCCAMFTLWRSCCPNKSSLDAISKGCVYFLTPTMACLFSRKDKDVFSVLPEAGTVASLWGPRDIMLDLETLGLSPGCAVLSLSAIVFDRFTGECGPDFNEVISRASCRDCGLREEKETVDWWTQQSEEARQASFDAVDCKPLKKVLKAFSQWFLAQGSKRRVWACGPQFDCTILEHCYEACGLKAPWDYYSLRDVRTIRDLIECRFGGLCPVRLHADSRLTPHVSIDDCRRQIEDVSHFFKHRALTQWEMGCLAIVWGVLMFGVSLAGVLIWIL